jgi:putative methyltransferase
MADAPSFWVRWHDDYADPESDRSQRLAVVRRRVREAIDRTTGPIRLISVCAGQGHDVIGVLADHPRSSEVAALLVELDEHNVALARKAAADAGLDGVRIVQADAARTSVYRDAVPADVLLLCGIFGNVSDDDVRTTVTNASRLCARDATVVWTRLRESPDKTPAIREWFVDAGFEEVAFDSPGLDRFSVGTNRLSRAPLDYRDDLTLFTFVTTGGAAASRGPNRAPRRSRRGSTPRSTGSS